MARDDDAFDLTGLPVALRKTLASLDKVRLRRCSCATKTNRARTPPPHARLAAAHAAKAVAARQGWLQRAGNGAENPKDSNAGARRRGKGGWSGRRREKSHV